MKGTSLSGFEIIIIIFSTIIIAVPFSVFLKNVDNIYLKDIVEIGNNFGSMLIPLLTLVGSVLVYVAFKAQIKANDEIRNQFLQQNFESLFFRLIDSLEKKILSYELVASGDKRHSGYNILPYFKKTILSESESVKVGFQNRLIVYHPELFTDENFKQFYNETSSILYDGLDDFKAKYLSFSIKERKDVLENEIVNINFNEDWKDFRNQVFEEHFYSLPIEFYHIFYSRITKKLFENHSTFFDGYYRTLKMVLVHIEKADEKDKNFYYDFLNDSLTGLEKVIILAYCGTGRFGKKTTNLLEKSQILANLNEIAGIRFVKNENYHKHIELLTSDNFPKNSQI